MLQIYFSQAQWDNTLIPNITRQRLRSKVNTVWHLKDKQLILNRYPKGQHDKSLQAWDSADEYIAEYCLSELQSALSQPKVTIVNDQFGALALAFSQYQPAVVTDSYVSQLAITQNSLDNALPEPTIVNSLQDWPNSDFVVLKLTKNIGYLEYQLQQLSQLSNPCKVVASGKTTLVTTNVLKLFEKYLSNVSTSLAKKKSRLIFADHQAAQSKPGKSKYPITVSWPEMAINLSSHANVFAKEQIDIGGRFLAENLPELSSGQRVIDLGCGNGLLGLSCLKQLKTKKLSANVCFVDESFMAVQSAKINVEQNFSELLDHCDFVQDDCLTSQPANSADVILCNPPFHQQNTITEHIAKQMFQQAYETLSIGGKLIVVANRHLPYQGQLKKLFGGFDVLAQNRKFVIFQCNKNK